MTQILQNLYLGGENEAMGNYILTNGIKSVVNVSIEVPRCPHVDDKNFLRIAIDDDPNEKILPFIQIFMDFMSRAEHNKHKILIHCYAGISRSVSFVIIYLMLRYSISMESAYNYIKSLRPFVNINRGFHNQVKILDDDIKRRRRR